MAATNAELLWQAMAEPAKARTEEFEHARQLFSRASPAAARGDRREEAAVERNAQTMAAQLRAAGNEIGGRPARHALSPTGMAAIAKLTSTYGRYGRRAEESF